MATTTSYGTWNNQIEPYALTVEQTIADSLGDFIDDYDVDAITREYRDAINDALPASVSLCGDEFIGPYYEADTAFESHPHNEDGELDLKAIVDGVDFWAIAAKHDTSE